VQSADLPTWAEQQAAALLADLSDRWAHVQGVAAQACRVSLAIAPEDRPYLVAAAWLHDIGYAPSLTGTGFHPIDGARHLRSLGHERLARLIAWHSSAVTEAPALGLADELAAFPPETSATADALTYCDMTTGPAGERVTMPERLAEIARRYGNDHLIVRCLHQARDHLDGAISRTTQRLQVAGLAE
jgi:HD superfamily phosphodiesterase